MKCALWVVSLGLDLIGLILDIAIDALDGLRRLTDRTNNVVWERYMAIDERTKP